MKKTLRQLMYGERFMWEGEEHALKEHDLSGSASAGPCITRIHDKHDHCVSYSHRDYSEIEVELVPRCISLWAPWAFALMYLGKDVENRSLASTVRGITGRIWIHASKWPMNGVPLKPKTKAFNDFFGQYQAAADIYMSQGPSFEVLPAEYEFEHIERTRGAIIGSMEITHYQEPDNPPDSIWYAQGQRAVMMRDPKPLSVPVPCGGALGFWRPDAETNSILERVRERDAA